LDGLCWKKIQQTPQGFWEQVFESSLKSLKAKAKLLRITNADKKEGKGVNGLDGK